MNDTKPATAEERAWRASYQAGMRPGSDDCPRDEELAALVVGEIDPEERAQLAEHIVACRKCAHDYRTLTALHREAGEPPVEGRSWRWRVVGVAAALIAAVGITLLWFGSPIRDTSMDDVVRGRFQAGVSPADGAVVSTSPAFNWPAQVGAVGYRVRLYNEAAEELWASERIESTSTRPPSDQGPELRPGAAYFWTVELEGEVARPLLGPFWFRMEE